MTHQFTTTVTGSGYEAYLVVDTLFHDRSAGGVRISDDIHVEEVRDLAREMSQKYALFRLPRGGAKMGVRLDADLPEGRRLEALEDLGKRLGGIIRAGIYYPGMDINCGPVELARIYRGAGIPIGTPTDSSYFTAISTASAIRGVVDALGLPRPVTLAIEGFGRVAHHLVGLLPAEYRVTALSTIEGAATAPPEGWTAAALQAARDAHGDRLVGSIPGTRVAHRDVLGASVDLLVPAARTRTLAGDLLGEVRAKAVVPIANAPYDTGGDAALHRRGVTVLPGYLVNGGGVLGSSLRDRGIPAAEVRALFDAQHEPLVAEIVRVARRVGTSPVEVTGHLAARELERRSGASRGSSLAAALRGRIERRLPARTRTGRIRRGFLEAFAGIRQDLEGLERT